MKEEAQTQQEEAIKLAVQATRQEMQILIDRSDRALSELEEKYAQESHKRRMLHNRLVELQGNIRVFCKVRPILQIEEESGSNAIVVEFPAENELLLYREEGTESRFEFDRVFTPTTSQEDVFRDVEDLIISVMDGFNVCIFAYGQTGSGKTFTMQGPQHDPGVNSRALDALFSVQKQREETWEYELHVGMMEIYNEQVYDLLSGEGKARIEIRQSSACPQDLVLEQVLSYEQVLDVLSRGSNNRAVGSHDMNEHSSRSHLVLLVTVVGKNKVIKSEVI